MDGEQIYDPASGATYACRLRLDGPHRLELRGHVGMPLLGRTTTWLRVGAEEQVCRDGGAGPRGRFGTVEPPTTR